MNYVVLKFGGSSLTCRGYHRIVSQINYLKNKYKVIVVLSAIQDTTNNLLCYLEHDRDRVFDLAQKHNTLMNGLNINSEEVDNIIDSLKQLDIENINLEQKINTISCGEKLSTMILSKYLSEQKIDHTLLNASEIIYSDSTFDQINEHNYSIKGSFRCDEDYLKKNLCDASVFILQGYIATTRDSMPCLLSRGGSDTTASLIAAAVNAKRLEIWTDVNGVYSGNPRMIRGTKVINYIGYDLCQELSAMGAKVLHPYCIKPCQQKKIPIVIKNTYEDNNNNTVISSRCEIDCDEIIAITNQENITVYDIKSLDMWNNYGFLYDIFGTFSDFRIDINIIITSQFSVRVTTDETDVEKIYNVAKEFEKKYQVKISRNCSIVSIVGYNISENGKVKKTQNIVKKMGRNNLHIIHYSSNNLTLSYVVNSSIAEELTQILHDSLISKNMINDDYEKSWWFSHIKEISAKLEQDDSVYLYNLDKVKSNCDFLRNKLTNISKMYYAMKANNNLDVLKIIIESGFGIECVSVNEIEYIRKNFGKAIDILFTPNYCNTKEYQIAFYHNATVIVDNIEVILNASEIFTGREIGIRIDCDIGDGHHAKVITEGENVKFGFPIDEVESLINIVDKFGIKVVGLHSHKGSGILDNNSWRRTANKLTNISVFFPNLKWINLGGGFGIKTNRKELDMDKVNKSLFPIVNKGFTIFIEPGRYLVAESGILLSRVTQVRKKNNTNFIGISTGMNSLIRPTLYNAYHPIYNISKLGEKNYLSYNIVGPICETGDMLGENRIMPKTSVNDIILIENSGAYGKVMSSNYNMRDSASECTIYFGL